MTLNKIKIAKVGAPGTNIFKYPDTQRRGHVKTEAETGGMQPKAKDS